MLNENMKLTDIKYKSSTLPNGYGGTSTLPNGYGGKEFQSTDSQYIIYEAPTSKNSDSLSNNSASSRPFVLKENHSTKQHINNDFNVMYMELNSSKHSSHCDGHFPHPRTDSLSQHHKSPVPKNPPYTGEKSGDSSGFDNSMKNNVAANSFKHGCGENTNVNNTYLENKNISHYSANMNYSSQQLSKPPSTDKVSVPSHGDNVSNSKQNSTKTMTHIDTASHQKPLRNIEKSSDPTLFQHIEKSQSVRPVTVPSSGDNLSASKHHSTKNMSQSIDYRKISNSDPKDADGKIMTGIEALKAYKCVKTSEFDYSIKLKKESKEFSFGWEFTRQFRHHSGLLDKVHSPHLTSTSSDQLKVLSSSEASTCKRKLNYETHLLPSTVANGRGTESNKGCQSTGSTVPSDPVVHSNYLTQTKQSNSSMINQPPYSSGGSSIRKPICDKNSTIDESTMSLISSKKERMPVYSGRKSAQGIKLDESQSTEKLIQPSEQCEPNKLKKIEELSKKAFEREQRKQKDSEGNLERLKSVTSRIYNGIAKAPPERQIKLVPIDFDNPERPQKKRTVDPVKPEVNERQIKLVPIDFDNPERPQKKRTVDPVKPMVNGLVPNDFNHHERPKKIKTGDLVKPEDNSSNGADSSNSPKLCAQKSFKDSKTAKKTVAPLMSKAKKMVSAVTRRR